MRVSIGYGTFSHPDFLPFFRRYHFRHSLIVASCGNPLFSRTTHGSWGTDKPTAHAKRLYGETYGSLYLARIRAILSITIGLRRCIRPIRLKVHLWKQSDHPLSPLFLHGLERSGLRQPIEDPDALIGVESVRSGSVLIHWSVRKVKRFRGTRLLKSIELPRYKEHP
jgi:hypothetical protein